MKKIITSIVLVSFISMKNDAQLNDYFPLFTKPNKLINNKGEIICEIPESYVIINDIDGKHHTVWNKGLPKLNFGLCENIVAKSFKKKKIKIFNLNGDILKDFGDKYLSISPCFEGFHVAKFIKKEKYHDDERFLYLDSNGNVIFNRNGYLNASIFSSGLAALREENNTWKFINDLGHTIDIIPKSLERISHISHFSNGLSKITTLEESVNKELSKKFFFINKEGEIILDIAKIFPNKKIKQVSNFLGKISCIEFFSQNSEESDYNNEVAYINTNGKVLGHYDDINIINIHDGGFISFLRSPKNIDSYPQLISSLGENIILPKRTSNIHHISNQYFYLSKKHTVDSIDIFDAIKKKVVYSISKSKIMGIQGNLAAFEEPNTSRYYVINMETNDIVYDTKISDLKIRSLKDYSGNYFDIYNFFCSSDDELTQIPKMINLKELTISGVGAYKLPDLSTLKNLNLLRIINCTNLIELPTNIANLTHYSIKHCTSVINLREAINTIPKLKKLYVVNMDISDDVKKSIYHKLPSANLIGNSKSFILPGATPGF